MTYPSCPIDTRDVVLSDDLLSLVERLAANNHDHWAAQRIAEGWTYATERSDAKKEHPDLVAYAEMPDSEKVYDRNSVKSTLEANLTFGYSITR